MDKELTYFLRNHFEEGMLLKASDLLMEQGKFIIAVETTKPIHNPIIVSWRAEVR